MEIVIDTSALITVIADEPEADIVIEYSQNATFVSPIVISFEIVNCLSRMLKKGRINDQSKMEELVNSFQKIPIKLFENNLQNIIQIVWTYKIYHMTLFSWIQQNY